MSDNSRVDFNQWIFLKNLFKGFYRSVWLCIFLSIFHSFLIFPSVLLVKQIFDRVIPDKDLSGLLIFSLLILLIYILNGVVGILTRKISLRTTKSVIENLRNMIVEKIFHFPKKVLSEEFKVKLHTITVQDTLRIDIMSNALLAQIVPSLFIGIGLLVILIYLNFYLFLVLMILSPIMFIISKSSGRNLKVRIRDYHRHFERFAGRVRNLLDFIDFTRIKSSEKREKEIQRNLHWELNGKSFIQAWAGGIYSIVNRTMVSSLGIFLLFTGGYLVITDKMSIGALISFFAAAGIIKNHLITIINVIPKVVEGKESLKTVCELLNREEELPYSGKKRIEFQGRINVNGIDFGYNGQNIFKNITMEIKPGEIVALTGANGSGKTSIVNLLLGFYRPNKGSVLADGIPYSELDLEYLRKFIGVVNQVPFIIPGTIYENLVYGLNKIPEKRIRDVMKLTYSTDLIKDKPEGLNTFIGCNGHYLSKGEIQRIALARVMLGEYRLIILDEPGNHISENDIIKILYNIKGLKYGPGILLITHRHDLEKISDRKFEIGKRDSIKENS